MLLIYRKISFFLRNTYDNIYARRIMMYVVMYEPLLSNGSTMENVAKCCQLVKGGHRTILFF